MCTDCEKGRELRRLHQRLRRLGALRVEILNSKLEILTGRVNKFGTDRIMEDGVMLRNRQREPPGCSFPMVRLNDSVVT